MLVTTIQIGSRNVVLRRPLSAFSITGKRVEWDYQGSEICSRAGGLPNRSIKHGKKNFGSLSHATQSALYGVNILERKVHHDVWNFARQSLLIRCIHLPHRLHPRRLNFVPLSGMQLSCFSSVPSLKPKEDKPTTTSTISSSATTSTLNASVKAATTTNTPLPSRKLGKTAVPTPPSAPPPDINPLQSLKDATPKSVIRKGVDLIVSASQVVVTHLMKLPGNIFFYATHPAETKAAYIRLRDTVKHEIHHYWVGTKLLWADIVTARKLLNKTLEGSALTRRERKQLLRTVSDLFRLIPFSMFVIVPFMEFALPFALRLFPNMLPSTYQDSLKAEENMKRELKSRIAMAQFFQEYVAHFTNTSFLGFAM